MTELLCPYEIYLPRVIECHFTETHRTVLNQILRQSQTPLSDGPFSVLVDYMKLLDFDVKNRYFKAELQKLDEGLLILLLDLLGYMWQLIVALRPLYLSY